MIIIGQGSRGRKGSELVKKGSLVATAEAVCGHVLLFIET